jgi:hypothetical protein
LSLVEEVLVEEVEEVLVVGVLVVGVLAELGLVLVVGVGRWPCLGRRKEW